MIDVNLDFPNVFDANEPAPLIPAALVPVLNGAVENIADPPENGAHANGDEDSDEGNETDDSLYVWLLLKSIKKIQISKKSFT